MKFIAIPQIVGRYCVLPILPKSPSTLLSTCDRMYTTYGRKSKDRCTIRDQTKAFCFGCVRSVFNATSIQQPLYCAVLTNKRTSRRSYWMKCGKPNTPRRDSNSQSVLTVPTRQLAGLPRHKAAGMFVTAHEGRNCWCRVALRNGCIPRATSLRISDRSSSAGAQQEDHVINTKCKME